MVEAQAAAADWPSRNGRRGNKATILLPSGAYLSIPVDCIEPEEPQCPERIT